MQLAEQLTQVTSSAGSWQTVTTADKEKGEKGFFSPVNTSTRKNGMVNERPARAFC